MRDWKSYAILGLSVVCVFLLFRSGPETPTPTHDAPHQAAQVTTWTCSMHPQIQQVEAGLCPLCGMELIPLEKDEDEDLGVWELKLTPAAKARADIQTATVSRFSIERDVELVGKVAIDEKRLTTVSSRVAGRLDRMFLDYTGIPVKRGDHMVAIYSPELLTASQELQSALNALDTQNASMKNAAQRRVNLVEDKLRLLGLSDARIAALKQGKVDAEQITVDSPVTGIVTAKHLNEGSYIKEGTPLYTVADLSRVWVTFQAYESDLGWLRFGQKLRFTVDAYPGETFTGRISFIDPILNPKTRTVSVRLEMANEHGKLKPEMLARGRVNAQFNASGDILDPDLKGKWISPMHPEIIKDGPGDCDVCGMDLVPAAELGIATEMTAESPLVIPESAALLTAKGAVVYVATDDAETRFQGREVELGPKANNLFVVKSGLNEGDRVVVNGAFKIDSELQIRAAGSMMYPPKTVAEKDHDHSDHEAHTDPHEGLQAHETSASFRQQLNPFYTAYFKLQVALSEDQFSADLVKPLTAALADLDDDSLSAAAQTAFKSWQKTTQQTLESIPSANDIAMARVHFESLSLQTERLFTQFGAPEEMPMFRYHCPMAFDNQGADWFQNQQGTANPYYGSMMYRCGSETEVLQRGAADE